MNVTTLKKEKNIAVLKNEGETYNSGFMSIKE